MSRIGRKPIDLPSGVSVKITPQAGVDREEAAKEARSHEELFDKFFDRLPKEFIHHRELFKSRLWRSPEVWQLERDFF